MALKDTHGTETDKRTGEVRHYWCEQNKNETYECTFTATDETDSVTLSMDANTSSWNDGPSIAARLETRITYTDAAALYRLLGDMLVNAHSEGRYKG